jgi:hypothetical protein
MRWKFNLFPAYRGTGARVTYIAADFREVRIRLPLSWRTRNVVGTIFGGSLYGAVDPIFMIMLIRLLGADYVVWDKVATIRFRRPGRTTLHSTFTIDEVELDAIRAATAGGRVGRQDVSRRAGGRRGRCSRGRGEGDLREAAVNRKPVARRHGLFGPNVHGLAIRSMKCR